MPSSLHLRSSRLWRSCRAAPMRLPRLGSPSGHPACWQDTAIPVRVVDSCIILFLIDSGSRDTAPGTPGHLEEDWLESQVVCLLKCSVSFSA